MPDNLYPRSSAELARRRHDLTPEIETAFEKFSKKVFEEGALPAKTKQLIAVAVAHVTQCPYCIRGHAKAASRNGATPKRSWKRFGSRPKCAQEVPTPIRHLPWTRSPPNTYLAGPNQRSVGVPSTSKELRP